jgi:hypothetical protein
MTSATIPSTDITYPAARNIAAVFARARPFMCGIGPKEGPDHEPDHKTRRPVARH